jgi:hypothetical protein
MTNNPKIEGSNSATGTGREKMAKKFNVHLSKGNRTVVEHSTRYPKIEGSKPAAGTVKGKMAK